MHHAAMFVRGAMARDAIHESPGATNAEVRVEFGAAIRIAGVVVESRAGESRSRAACRDGHPRSFRRARGTRSRATWRRSDRSRARRRGRVHDCEASVRSTDWVALERHSAALGAQRVRVAGDGFRCCLPNSRSPSKDPMNDHRSRNPRPAHASPADTIGDRCRVRRQRLERPYVPAVRRVGVGNQRTAQVRLPRRDPASRPRCGIGTDRRGGAADVFR